MPRRQEVSRDRVLHVASRLFYEQGVRATGVAEVIAAAGCGKQALYRLFPSKDHLVAAYLEQIAADQEGGVEQALKAAGEDPSAQLIALTADAVRRAGRPGFRGCAMRNYMREHPSHDTRAGEVAEQFLRRARERLDELAGAACPDRADSVAQKVWVIHEGLWANSSASAAELSVAVDLVAELVAT